MKERKHAKYSSLLTGRGPLSGRKTPKRSPCCVDISVENMDCNWVSDKGRGLRCVWLNKDPSQDSRGVYIVNLLNQGGTRERKREKKAGSVFGAASRSSLAAYPGLALAKLVKYANASLSRAHLIDTWASFTCHFFNLLFFTLSRSR